MSSAKRSIPLSADLVEDLLAAGQLALLEAKREYDAENPEQASLATFALPRIKRAVIDAISAYRDVPRGIYRSAKRDAAAARAEARAPLDVLTKQWIANAIAAAGTWQNPEPFTDIEWGLKRDEIHAAIERMPFAREREIVRMVGLEGIAQRAAGERFGIQQAAASKVLKSGLEMLQDLLEIGSALDVERVPSTLEKLRDLRQRRAIALLYGDRVEPERACEALRMGSVEFRRLHQGALRAIKRAVVDREHAV